MAAHLDIRRKRAAYRAAHRGTKEMDWLLGRYAEAKLADMDETRLGAFEALMEEPDPDLQAWIMEGLSAPDSHHAALIRELRAFHALEQKGSGPV